MADHRTPVLDALGRSDPATSRDPRVRELISQLAALPAPEPRPEFRADLRAQLVAIAPRIIAEGEPAVTAETRATTRTSVSRRFRAPQLAGKSGGGTAARPVARTGGMALARPLTAAAALAIVATMALSGGLLLSRNALPGDALYGLKRAGEGAQLTFDRTDTSRAMDQLHFATKRVAEVQALLARSRTAALGSGTQAGGALGDASTNSSITAALSTADQETTEGARLLNTTAVRRMNAAPLTTLTLWAKAQATGIHAIWKKAPTKALQNRMSASLTLVNMAASRSYALHAEIGKPCVKTTGSDKFGPKACRSNQVHKAGQLAGGTTPPSPGTPSGGTAGSGTAGSGPAKPGSSTSGGSTTGGSTTGGSTTGGSTTGGSNSTHGGGSTSASSAGTSTSAPVAGAQPVHPGGPVPSTAVLATHAALPATSVPTILRPAPPLPSASCTKILGPVRLPIGCTP